MKLSAKHKARRDARKKALARLRRWTKKHDGHKGVETSYGKALCRQCGVSASNSLAGKFSERKLPKPTPDRVARARRKALEVALCDHGFKVVERLSTRGAHKTWLRLPTDRSRSDVCAAALLSMQTFRQRTDTEITSESAWENSDDLRYADTERSFSVETQTNSDDHPFYPGVFIAVPRTQDYKNGLDC